MSQCYAEIPVRHGALRFRVQWPRRFVPGDRVRGYLLEGLGVETNTVTLTVQPQAAGPFYFYVRGTMHKTGGAACDFVNGAPGSGEAGFTDQQGLGGQTLCRHRPSTSARPGAGVHRSGRRRG